MIDRLSQPQETVVHIRIQQRNGRKSITIVEELASDLDLKRILRAFKRNFKCNGSIVNDGTVIQLTGDQRQNVLKFLIDQELCLRERVAIHGF